MALVPTGGITTAACAALGVSCASVHRRRARLTALPAIVRPVESKRPGWRNPKHGAQWLATLGAYAFPEIGDMPVADVDTAAVLRVPRPIWERVPETASRVRQRMEAVLDASLRGRAYWNAEHVVGRPDFWLAPSWSAAIHR